MIDIVDIVVFVSGWIATGIIIGWFVHVIVKRRQLLRLHETLLKQAKSSKDRDIASAYEDAADDVWRVLTL